MNRAEYMAQLSYLLQDMEAADREDVLQYYEDYFDEGGLEKEEEIIRTLGSPERLAAMIRDGLGNDNAGVNGEYTENGYRDERYREDNKVPQKFFRTFQEQKESGHILMDKERSRRNNILLLIILVVFFFVAGPSLPTILLIAVVVWFLNYFRNHKNKKEEEKEHEKNL